MIRAVIDTNVLVSALIKPDSPAGPILRKLGEGNFQLIFSPAVLDELIRVLAYPKLRKKYKISREDMETVVAILVLRGEMVFPSRSIRVCRDPHDDIFIEAAVSGSADYLVSGDSDLLALNKFEGVKILSPGDFLRIL
jgi:putative PIN family toxin of toxin-antitoxin system